MPLIHRLYHVLYFLSLTFLTYFKTDVLLAKPREVLLIVGSPEEEGYKKGDSIFVVGAGYVNLQQLLADTHSQIELEFLEISSLDNLVSETNKFLSPSDRIKRIAFLGHGNVDNYALSSKAIYNGKQVADYVDALLSDKRIEENFAVYFSGCLIGGFNPDGENFQNQFVENVVNYIKTKHTKIKNFFSTAHIYESISANGIRHSWLDTVLYKFDRVIKVVRIAVKFLFRNPVSISLTVATFAAIGFLVSSFNLTDAQKFLLILLGPATAGLASALELIYRESVQTKIVSTKVWENGKLTDRKGFVNEELTSSLGLTCGTVNAFSR